MVATLLAKLLGFFKIALFANTYGTPAILDAYKSAFLVPDLFTNLFILGAFSSGFIPVYAHYVDNNEMKKAWKLANVVTTIVLSSIVILSVLAFIFAPWVARVIAPGYDQEKLQYTVDFLRILLVSPFLLALSNIFSSILNSHHRFTASAFAPVFYNVGIILGVVVFEPLWGMVTGLSMGVIVGAFMHAGVQLIPVWKLGFSFQPDFDYKYEPAQEVFWLALPRIISMAAMQIDLYVDKSLASFLPDGSLIALDYAFSLQGMPVGIFGMAIATASFPLFVQRVSQGDLGGFQSVLLDNIKLVLYFTIPAMVGMVVLRVELVRMILGISGELDWDQTRSIAFTLALYALSIPAQAMIYVLNKAFYALKDTKTPVIAAILSVVTNSLFSVLFISMTPHFSMLALSFTIASLLQMMLLGALLNGKIGGFAIIGLLPSISLITIASFTMGVNVWLLDNFMANVLDMTRVSSVFIDVFCCTLYGLAVYVLITVILGKHEYPLIREVRLRVKQVILSWE